MRIAGSLLFIVIAGIAGAAAAWFVVVETLGWTGLAGALATVLLAMGGAVVVFALGIRALKAAGWVR